MYNRVAIFFSKKFNFDAHYFLKGGFWLSLGQFATIALGVLSAALFAHFLPENEFGSYRYLITVAVFLSTFSLYGLGQSIVQAVAQKHLNFYSESLTINIKYSLLTSFFALGVATYYFINNNDLLAFGCLAIALLQPIINIFQFTPGYFFAKGDFKRSTFIQITKTTVPFIVSIVVLLLTKNILILFISYLSSQAFIGYLLHKFVKTVKNNRTPESVFSQYISYAKHTSIRSLISSIAFRLDGIIIFTQLGAVELAMYTVAILIPEQIKGSFKNIGSLLLPKYTMQNDINVFKRTLHMRSLQLFFLLFLITIGYILIAPFIFNFLFPKYTDAIIYSQLLALAFPAFVSIIPSSMLQAQMREQDLYSQSIINSTVRLLTLIVFIPLFGILGAIISTILTRYINMFISFYYLNRIQS